MLLQLPNGNWVNPELIVAIRVLGRSERNPPRVCVDFDNGDVQVITFEYIDDAETYRDNLATMHNQQRTLNQIP